MGLNSSHPRRDSNLCHYGYIGYIHIPEKYSITTIRSRLQKKKLFSFLWIRTKQFWIPFKNQNHSSISLLLAIWNPNMLQIWVPMYHILRQPRVRKITKSLEFIFLFVLLADWFAQNNLRWQSDTYNVYYYWHDSGSYNYWWDKCHPLPF